MLASSALRLLGVLARRLAEWAEQDDRADARSQDGESPLTTSDEPTEPLEEADDGDGPPAHWLEMIRSRAPHLLAGDKWRTRGSPSSVEPTAWRATTPVAAYEEAAADARPRGRADVTPREPDRGPGEQVMESAAPADRILPHLRRREARVPSADVPQGVVASSDEPAKSSEPRRARVAPWVALRRALAPLENATTPPSRSTSGRAAPLTEKLRIAREPARGPVVPARAPVGARRSDGDRVAVRESIAKNLESIPRSARPAPLPAPQREARPVRDGLRTGPETGRSERSRAAAQSSRREPEAFEASWIAARAEHRRGGGSPGGADKGRSSVARDSIPPLRRPAERVASPPWLAEATWPHLPDEEPAAGSLQEAALEWPSLPDEPPAGPRGSGDGDREALLLAEQRGQRWNDARF